jgi:hypothetical protein
MIMIYVTRIDAGTPELGEWRDRSSSELHEQDLI